MKLSWTSIRTFEECPRKFKLRNLDKIPHNRFSEFTAFGSAVHQILEINREASEFKNVFADVLTKEIAAKFFIEWYHSNKTIDIKEFRMFDSRLVQTMFNQGEPLVHAAREELEKKFGKFEVVWVERGFDVDDVHGFVDLVLKTQNGRYHIIDYKTTSWGWNIDKQRDPLTTYQLSLYKHFLAKQENIDPRFVETYFLILKRNSGKAEILRMSSGEKKKNNMLQMVEKVRFNVNKYLENSEMNKFRFPPLSQDCKWCPFRDSKWCDRK